MLTFPTDEDDDIEIVSTLLSPFLRRHFQHDCLEDVPRDVWDSTFLSTERVVENPELYPHADFDYLDQLWDEMQLYQVRCGLRRPWMN